MYFSSEPLIRRTLFNSPTAITAYFGTLVHGIVVWSLLYYMPLYFEVAKKYSPITSGVALFPFTFTTAPAAVVVGIVITKTGRYRPSVVSLPPLLPFLLPNPASLLLTAYLVDRMVSYHIRNGFIGVLAYQHFDPCMDLPLPRRWHRNRNALLSPRFRSPSLSLKL